ncbi:beta-galactosidase [Spirochaetia bacterium]|nr:beta-galactosidase [Spirochaetia bacterium]
MKRQDFNKNWVLQKEDGSRVKLDLPHDAMIAEQRSPDSPGGSANAYFPGGVYVYEKTFDVPENWQDKYITFQFEGVYKNSKVYINGTEAGGRPYGYIPFFVETKGLLNYGAENIIRVVADNIQLPNSRWYTGSGIYRPVWLWTGGNNHINIEGVKISTLSYAPAHIKVETSYTGGNVAVAIQRDGKIIAEGEGDTLILDIPNAQLWSDETPELYQCHVTLTENGAIVDETTETFGIRLVEWSPKGLFVNGKKTLLRGGCVHHDNGILGARTYAESEDRRVRILKQAGFNAIRSSHYPASSAMLDACDKYGMYVMDETWDMWYEHKSKYDYAADFIDNYKTDIKAMVDRDFNHPGVIMYSIGNEISESHEQKGIDLVKEMTEYVHSIDINRAVTCGCNLWLISKASKGKSVYKKEGGLASGDDKKKSQALQSSTLFNFITSMVGTGMNKNANAKAADIVTSPCLDILDIAGYNYASGRYPLEGKAHPNRIVMGSETFPQDIAKNWAMVKNHPYLVGDFMWTAWDYLGEAGLGAWAYSDDGKGFNKPYPWLLAEAGAIDILGNIGAEAEYAATVWGLRKQPYIGVQPVNHPGITPAKMVWRGTNAIASWSWQGCEGNKAVVEVYADAHHVELLLNKRRIAKKEINNYKAIFKMRYIPGTLTAVAYDKNGGELSRSDLFSAKGSPRINIYLEKNTVNAGEIVYADINITGENGIKESNADTKLNVTVAGGTLLAFGSANPRTEESYLSGSFTTYYGWAQAVVQADEAGVIRITASGGNMESVFAEIEAV